MQGIRRLVVIILVLSSSTTYAQCDSESETKYFEAENRLICSQPRLYYIGANFKNTWNSARGDWRNLFVTPKPGFDIYVGWRFHPLFALQFGYAWTADKMISFLVPNNTSLLGITNTTGSPIDGTSKVMFKTGYVDLYFLLPLPLLYTFDWCRFIRPEAMVSLGVGGMKPRIKVHMQPLTTATMPFTSQFTQIDGRSKAVFRLGLGMQTMVSEIVGVRALWGFETTSTSRARNSKVTGAPGTREIWGNAQTLAFGIFMMY